MLETAWGKVRRLILQSYQTQIARELVSHSSSPNQTL